MTTNRSTTNKSTQINFRCPNDLLHRLNAAIGNGSQRTSFIIEALEEKLERIITKEFKKPPARKTKNIDYPFTLSKHLKTAELQQSIGMLIIKLRKNHSFDKIAQLLNQKGYRTGRGNLWTKDLVSNFYNKNLKK